jgi:hypothetical protein
MFRNRSAGLRRTEGKGNFRKFDDDDQSDQAGIYSLIEKAFYSRNGGGS